MAEKKTILLIISRTSVGLIHEIDKNFKFCNHIIIKKTLGISQNQKN